MAKYKAFKPSSVGYVHDTANDVWLKDGRHAYQKIRWKHIPKYAREKIAILNIAGPGVWVQDCGEIRIAVNGMPHYTVLDPIRLWEIQWSTHRR